MLDEPRGAADSSDEISGVPTPSPATTVSPLVEGTEADQLIGGLRKSVFIEMRPNSIMCLERTGAGRERLVAKHRQAEQNVDEIFR